MVKTCGYIELDGEGNIIKEGETKVVIENGKITKILWDGEVVNL